jgi:hypothetical protein
MLSYFPVLFLYRAYPTPSFQDMYHLKIVVNPMDARILDIVLLVTLLCNF